MSSPCFSSVIEYLVKENAENLPKFVFYFDYGFSLGRVLKKCHDTYKFLIDNRGLDWAKTYALRVMPEKVDLILSFNERGMDELFSEALFRKENCYIKEVPASTSEELLNIVNSLRSSDEEKAKYLKELRRLNIIQQ